MVRFVQGHLGHRGAEVTAKEKRGKSLFGRVWVMFVVAALLAVAGNVMPGLGAHGMASAAPSLSGRYVTLSGNVQFSDNYVASDATVYILPYGSTNSNDAYGVFSTNEDGYFATTTDYGDTGWTFRVDRRYTIEVDATDSYGTTYSHYFAITVPSYATGIWHYSLTFNATYY